MRLKHVIVIVTIIEIQYFLVMMIHKTINGQKLHVPVPAGQWKA